MMGKPCASWRCGHTGCILLLHPIQGTGLGLQQLFALSPASLLPSHPQLQDRASFAHNLSTSAVSQGKAVVSGAESLLGSLEGKRLWAEHFCSQPGCLHWVPKGWLSLQA